MSLVHNEQTKLSATWLNGVAIASVAVGGIAPLVSLVVAGTPNAALTVLSSAVWLSIGGVLHFVARLLLRALKP